MRWQEKRGVGGMCGSDEERRGRRRREVEGENGKERWEEKKSLVKKRYQKSLGMGGWSGGLMILDGVRKGEGREKVRSPAGQGQAKWFLGTEYAGCWVVVRVVVRGVRGVRGARYLGPGGRGGMERRSKVGRKEEEDEEEVGEKVWSGLGLARDWTFGALALGLGR